MKNTSACGRLLCLVLTCVQAPSQARRLELFRLGNHTIVQYGIYRDAVSDEGNNLSDHARAANILDLVFDYSLSEKHRFLSLLRWAQGNGLNNSGALNMAPYGGDVEDDVRNINGHNRDYLLKARWRCVYTCHEVVIFSKHTVDNARLLEGQADSHFVG